MVHSKLDETTNIIDLYLHCTGISKVPAEWHLWTCLTMIAAAVQDRAAYYKMPWKPLYPNMYTFLIGESGWGKGQAISFGGQLEQPFMNYLYGSMTYKSLVDKFILEPLPGLPEWNKSIIVMPELADNIGSGGLSDGFVKSMTNWYGSERESMMDSTRRHGEKVFGRPVLSWLAGTTISWLRQSIDVEALRSGFFGRVVPIPVFIRGPELYHPKYPRDFQIVMEHLRGRFLEFGRLEDCQFRLADDARDADENWFYNRPKPDIATMAFYEREPELSLKLGMLLSLADSLNMVIELPHILQAHDLIATVRMNMPRMLESATITGEAKNYAVVRNMVERANGDWVTRRVIQQAAGSYHIRARELDAILSEMEDGEYIQSRPVGRSFHYRWTYNPNSVALRNARKIENVANPLTLKDTMEQIKDKRTEQRLKDGGPSTEEALWEMGMTIEDALDARSSH